MGSEVTTKRPSLQRQLSRKRPTIQQRTAELAIAERDIAVLKALLREASPPFGQTSERREWWKRRRDEELGKRGA
jgi:hypothetical protein